ncbi:MAG: riboflavin synthase [Proteobacteria bacterium]|jgi:riboflavin synthase|nr:riboflavin synthase [Pseudomonadota bacterium]
MFTGLIEDVGTIAAVRPRGTGQEIHIRTKIPLGEVALGDSVAVNGVCLTAEAFATETMVMVAAKETIEVTTLSKVRPGRRVHLERALRLGDRLGGHLVQGHVDGVGRLRSNSDARGSRVLWVELPANILRYVAPKGSICIDGASLTVNDIQDSAVRVNLVPHTLRATRFGSLRPGDSVNIEVDVLAKYVEQLLRGTKGDVLNLETLKRHGF